MITKMDKLHTFLMKNYRCNLEPSLISIFIFVCWWRIYWRKQGRRDGGGQDWKAADVVVSSQIKFLFRIRIFNFYLKIKIFINSNNLWFYMNASYIISSCPFCHPHHWSNVLLEGKLSSWSHSNHHSRALVQCDIFLNTTLWHCNPLFSPSHSIRWLAWSSSVFSISWTWGGSGSTITIRPWSWPWPASCDWSSFP